MSLDGLSILIPTHNYSVTTLVESLVNQSSKIDSKIEIIVYEDGSSLFLSENASVENTANVTYIHGDENIGRAAARQFLAEKADFQWLLFVCSLFFCQAYQIFYQVFRICLKPVQPIV